MRRALLGTGLTAAVIAVTQLPAAAAPGGSISGIVRDAVTGTPIAGICVTADPGYNAPPMTTTSIAGTYTFQQLPAGSYRVAFQSCSAATADYLTELYHNHFTGPGDPVSVTDGGAAVGVDADMQKAGSISGVITDAVTGAGVPNVQVDIEPLDVDSANQGTGPAFTDSQGRYTFPRLTPGHFQVSVSPDASTAYLPSSYPGTPYGTAAQPVAVTAGQDHAGIDVALHHGTLSGTVRDPDGNPEVGDTVVLAESGSVQIAARATVGSDGSYEVKGLAPGSYDVHVNGWQRSSLDSNQWACPYDDEWYDDSATQDAATHIQVGLDADVVLANSTTLQPPGTLTVHVVDVNGAPVVGASVGASTAASPYTDPADETCQRTSMQGTTDASGAATGTLRHGPATVSVSAPGFFDADATSVVTSASHQDITITMQRPAIIDGTVTDSAGHPLAGVTVHGGQPLGPFDGHYYQEWDATSDANGHWENTTVHAGKWRVTFTDNDSSRPGGAFPPRYYPSTFSSATTVAAGDGEHLTLDNETLLRGARIVGSLATAEGAPAPNYTQIVAEPADTQAGGAVANPDANGNFSLGPLDPGNYRLEFTNDSPYATSWYRGADDQSSATILPLTDGQTVTANDTLHYPPAQTPSGPPPPEPTVAFNDGPTGYSGRTATFSFTSTNAVKTTCGLDGAAQSPCTSPVTFNSLQSGNHQVEVIAINPAGHSATATRSWRTDIDPPGVHPGLSRTIDFTLARTVRFPYTADDSGAGLASYDARYRTGAWDAALGAWHYPSAWQHTTSTSVLAVLGKGQTMCVSVRARDVVGNTSPWSQQQCRARALDDRALSATTGWARGRDSRDYGGTYSKALRPGAQLSLPATRSDQIALVVMACPTCGSVDVLVGGKLIDDVVDLTSSRVHRHLLVRLNPYLARFGRIVVRAHSGHPVIDGLAVSHCLYRATFGYPR